MLTILVICIVIIIVVLLLSVLTTSKAYKYEHTIDPLQAETKQNDDEVQNKRE
jgi:uncharacterized protein YpmB